MLLTWKRNNFNNQIELDFCGPTVCGVYLYGVAVHLAVVATDNGIFNFYLGNTTYGYKEKFKMSEKELVIKVLLNRVHN